MGKISRLATKVKNLVRRRSYASDEMDRKLAARLNIKNGFFIEAGANDGLRQSNTLYFEKYYNWQGLLVEPVPRLAEACRRNRPRCAVEGVALVPLDFEQSHVDMRYCDLMSQIKGAMDTEDEELAHVQLGCQVQQIETHDLRVPARPLSSLLDEHGVEQVDLLSLDVEGFELQALQGIDFDRHRPRFMLIEVRDPTEIENHLHPLYEPVAEFSRRINRADVLYRLKAA